MRPNDTGQTNPDDRPDDMKKDRGWSPAIDTHLRNLAHGIAAHLDGFTITTSDDLGHAAWLDHPDGRRLFLGPAHWNQPDRIHISGELPRSDYYFRDAERPHPITVSRTRAPQAIARDIQRRLMPTYTQALAKVRARIAERAAEHTHRTSIAQRLAAQLPDARLDSDPDKTDTTIRWSTSGTDDHAIGSGDIRMYGAATTATVKLSSIGIAALDRVVAALGVPVPAGPDAATVGSIAHGDVIAHYIVWASGEDVAWGTVDFTPGLTDQRLRDTVNAHLRQHAEAIPVSAWHTADLAVANGTLTTSEVAWAAELIGEAIGQRLGHTGQTVTVKAVAEAWTAKSLDRGTLLNDQQPLHDALDLLADHGLVHATGHDQILRALFNYATTAATRVTAEAAASGVPLHPDVPETVRLIRQHLTQRSGRAWSVTNGRGTSYGRITIHAAPADRDQHGGMTQADQTLLARLLDLPNGAHQQGVSVPASTRHRRDYIARAMGITPPDPGLPS